MRLRSVCGEILRYDRMERLPRFHIFGEAQKSNVLEIINLSSNFPCTWNVICLGTAANNVDSWVILLYSENCVSYINMKV